MFFYRRQNKFKDAYTHNKISNWSPFKLIIFLSSAKNI